MLRDISTYAWTWQMKDYLRAAIGESIRRAELLKKSIPRPLPVPELSGVAERCNELIDHCLIVFNDIINDEKFGQEQYLAGHFRKFRRATRLMSIVEEDGIPALVRFTADEEFLTRLLFRIHQEIGFPLMPPIAACFAHDYYRIQPFTNVVYVPLIEGHCLLHLPDLLHEMGHLIVYKLKDSVVQGFRTYYQKAIEVIDDYYSNRVRSRKRGGPKGYAKLEDHLRNQWTDNWAEEFACDLFATFVLGPAYAWAHLHLTTKREKELFRFSHEEDLSHPANDARMKSILTALNLTNFGTEAGIIESKWEQIPVLLGQKADPDYHLAYPQDLIERFAVEIHRGVRAAGCKLADAESSSSPGPIISLLNEAWLRFWQEPHTYSDWENEQVREWRSKLIVSNPRTAADETLSNGQRFIVSKGYVNVKR